MNVRTRFAPSPTGYLHVGGARTALFNYLFAKKHGGSFVLRVEDSDASRNTESARAAIFSGLSWLGLKWDEGPDSPPENSFGPYNQSERTEIYDRHFETLKTAGRIYEEEGAWRFRFDRCPIVMNDMVCGEVTIDYSDASNTPDMVIKRSDGSYVFHFVNVVDDLEMKISHVIRGEDHLMNTPKHLQLFDALGVVPPVYAHIPLILNPDGSKMSKRDAGAAVGDYPPRGFIPSAVINFLALLGWNPKTEEEIFDIDQLIEIFSLENVNRAPARFDGEKCAWVNQQHLLQLPTTEFVERARAFVVESGLPITERYPPAAAALKEKVRLLTEVPEAIAFLLKDDFPIDPDALAKVSKNGRATTLLTDLATHFENLDDWCAETAKEAIATTAVENDAKPGQLMFPTRIALSGKPSGPDLGAILEILGQETATARIRRLVSLL